MLESSYAQGGITWHGWRELYALGDLAGFPGCRRVNRGEVMIEIRELTRFFFSPALILPDPGAMLVAPSLF